MSDMDVEKLYQEAMLALETDNPRKATDLLKQVVEQDPDRVDAWVELAKLVEDRDEKRMTLTTILQLDPENAYAKAELQAVESVDKPKKLPDDEIAPGIKRSEARLVGIGLGIFTLVAAVICCVALVGASGRRSAQAAALTEASIGQTSTLDAQIAMQGTNAAEMTAEIETATAAFFLTVTPTFTPSRTPNLPPSRTPTPEFVETQVSFASGLPPAPTTLTGRIYAWGGRDVLHSGFTSFRRYAAGGAGAFENVNDDLIKSPSGDALGANVVYLQSITGGWALARISDSNAGFTELLNSRFANQNVIEPISPSQSADGTKLVFVAKSVETSTTAVYLMDFTANNTFRLTSDTANYTGAAISPDGTLVVAARNDGTATDLVLIEAANAVDGFPQHPVTSDGAASVEAQPDFSADGALVTFSYTQGNPQESNLAVVRVAGGIISPVEPIMTVDGDDIYPQFSPDGAFVAFASNRAAGIYNLYIYDRNTRATYQLTEEEDNVFPGSWTQ